MSVPMVIPVNTWLQIRPAAYGSVGVQAGGPSGVRFFNAAANPGSSDASSGVVFGSGTYTTIGTSNAALALWARSLFTDDVAAVLVAE